MSTISKGILAMLESGPKTISELYEGVPGKRASIGDRPPNEFGGNLCKSYAEAFVEFRSG